MQHKNKSIPFIIQLFFSTNHKDIGTLSLLLFSLFSGLIGTLLSVVIVIQFALPGYFIINYHTFNVIVTAHGLLLSFLCLFVSIFLFFFFNSLLSLENKELLLSSFYFFLITLI